MSFKFPKALEPFYNEECWVGWKREARPDGTFTKPPYQPANPALRAKPNDPSTWGSITQTLANVERELLDGPGICALEAHIGAHLFVGVDVDRCIDAEGNIEPRAVEIIKAFNSYTEFSPSRTGVHIYALSDGDKLNRNFKGLARTQNMGVEIARKAAKYFTVTGDIVPGSPETLRYVDGLADELVRQLDEEEKSAPRKWKANFDYLYQHGAPLHQRSDAAWWVINQSLRHGKTADEIVRWVLDPNNKIGDHYREHPQGPEKSLRRHIEEARAKDPNLPPEPPRSSQQPPPPPPPQQPQQPSPPPQHGLPELIINAGNLPETARELGKLFAERRRFLSNGREPVQVVCDNDGMPRAVVVTPESVRCFAHQLCVPKKFHLREKKLLGSTITVDVANLYLHGLIGEWGLRPFNGITTAPILSDDGSFRAAAGYDEASGLWCHNVPAVDVPDEPTRAQVRASLDALRAAFRTFAFADATVVRDDSLGVNVVDPTAEIGLDESSFLVGLMTAVCRASLPLAPGILANAPAFSGAGTGKGLAVKAICIIASGASPSAFTSGHDVQEMDKRLTAALIEARPAIFLDNYNSKDLTSDILASALTENPCEVRPMGSTAMVRLHTRTLVGMTGNAVRIAEDMVSRVVMSNFDAKVEHPELRPFAPGFLGTVYAARAALLGHALTIWRWGRQNPGVLTRGKPLRNYDTWAVWCRDPLLALKLRDPVDRLEALKSADPKRRRIQEVFDAWWEAHGNALVAAKDLRQSVLETIDGKASTNKDGVFKYNRQYVAHWLQNHTNTRVAGFVLTSENVASGKRPSINYRLTDGTF